MSQGGTPNLVTMMEVKGIFHLDFVHISNLSRNYIVDALEKLIATIHTDIGREPIAVYTIERENSMYYTNLYTRSSIFVLCKM